jgi:hypothetical protein
MADRYSDIIRAVAAQAQVLYLPLRESMKTYLAAHPSRPRIGLEDTERALQKGALAYYVLGKSWDDVARWHGCSLVFDNLHLNNPAAVLVADLVSEFLIENSVKN